MTTQSESQPTLSKGRVGSEPRALEEARIQLERFAAIIEGRGEARLVVPHGMTSNGPRRALELLAGEAAALLPEPTWCEHGIRNDANCSRCPVPEPTLDVERLRTAAFDGTDADTGDIWLHREDADLLRNLLARLSEPKP